MIELNNRKILVTGGCGFIGSNFIEYVFSNYKNVDLTNIDKMGVGSRPLFFKEDLIYNVVPIKNDNIYRFCKKDIVELEPNFSNENRRAFPYDYIFHFAAESHVDRSITGPEPFIKNNVMGMVRLLEWFRTNQPQARLINISTDECYGHLQKNDLPFTELSKFAPRSPYAASKASADLIANSYVTTYGLDIVTTHCCNNFGPYQAEEKFIPVVIKNILSNNKIPVYGTGENIREWIHVEDHNKSLLEIAEIGERGKRYNISSKIEKTNMDMILDIGVILDKIPNIEYVEDRKGHDFRYAIDSIRYQRRFKLKAHHEALKETVDFYKAESNQI
jgi:dTDP-glucose 4,6-dehydratase